MFRKARGSENLKDFRNNLLYTPRVTHDSLRLDILFNILSKLDHARVLLEFSAFPRTPRIGMSVLVSSI